MQYCACVSDANPLLSLLCMLQGCLLVGPPAAGKTCSRTHWQYCARVSDATLMLSLLRFAQGCLLVGPLGTGKTMLARAITVPCYCL
jgi:ATP-dependent 26S proteasome regulatory subunit